LRVYLSLTIAFLTIAAAPRAQNDAVGTPADTVESSAVGSTPNQHSPDTLPPIERMPEVIMRVDARYPPELAKQGIEGTVLLDCIVSDSGAVDSVAVVEGVHPVLDSSAAAALRNYRFTPAIAGGEPVPVLLQYEYPFVLKEVVRKLEKYENFTGRLLERGTKTPIADAMVVVNFIDTVSDTALDVPFSVYRERIGRFDGQYIEEDRLVTVTDSNGYFSFFSLPACTIEVSAPLPGYEDFKEREVINPEEQLDVVYYIRRVSYSDYEIVVYGKVEEKEVSRRQLTVHEVKKIPGLGGDAVRVVQALPGVARPTFGSGEVIVRGSPSWDSKFYLDGVELPLLYHFGGMKSVYNSDALESVDFYPGGFGTRYGGAVAGAIEISGRSPETDRWHGTLDMGTGDVTFLVEGPVNEKVSVMASGRRSVFGELLKLLFKYAPSDFPITVYPFYWDYLVRTDFTLSETNTSFVTFFGARDSMAIFAPTIDMGSDEVDEATDHLGMKITFHMGLAGWDWKLRPELKNSLRYAFTYASNRTSVFGLVKVEETALMNHIRDELSYSLLDNLTFNLGADCNVMVDDLILVIPGGSNAIMRDTTENWLFGTLGGYINAEWKPRENIQIIPGVRYDFFPELDYRGSKYPEYWRYSSFDNTTRYNGEPSVRINGRYECIEGHTLKAAAGNYSQTPQPIGQVIHPTWGDPALPATKAAHYVGGYEWQITDLIHADIQMYWNRQWNIPRMESSTDFSTDGGSGQLWRDDGRGRMRGAELMLRHDRGERFFGWLAYSLSKSERYNHETEEYELFGNDQTHNVQLLGSWHLKRDWDVGFRARYVTGNPTTPVDSVGYNENLLYYFAYPGRKNSLRMPPFFQLDVRMDKTFVFDKWMFSFYVDIQNISWFFYKSPELEMYNYDYSEKIRVSNFITPAIGYKAEF
jgi:TonB family protein